MQWTLKPFRKTETLMGDGASHEQIGQLLLVASGMGPELAIGVGRHHTVGKSPSSLVCLIHLANNLCRDLGLGYFEEEQGVYSKAVLNKLNLTREDVKSLQETLGDEIVGEVKELVGQCT